MKKIQIALLAVAGLTSASLSAHAQIDLVGFEVYQPDNSTGATANNYIRYDSNSASTNASGIPITDTTSGVASTGKGIDFALQLGANTFTYGNGSEYNMTPNFVLEAFFAAGDGDGTASYNPTGSKIIGDLNVVGPTDGATSATTIASGVGVGNYGDANGPGTSAPSNGLSTYVVTTSGGPYDISFASAIQGANSTGSFTIDVTAAPEPKTYALMAIGLGALAFFGRRRLFV